MVQKTQTDCPKISHINSDHIFTPDNEFQSFIDSCNSIFLENNINETAELANIFNINSRYYGIMEFNNIKSDPKSTFSLIHTNIASLGLHFDELHQVLSSLTIMFDIIGITEHKIHKDAVSISNLDIEGYRPFLYDPTETSHGRSGIYISKSINCIKRDDLKFNSKGDFESTFIEIIQHNKKNMIIGCIYRHPSSTINVKDFNDRYIDPLLNKLNREGKLCSLMGDFNIDLMKSDTNDSYNEFYTNLASHFFVPYILQPTRPISKSLIDNIFVNTIEYSSFSGNLTIQLADHLF